VKLLLVSLFILIWDILDVWPRFFEAGPRIGEFNFTVKPPRKNCLKIKKLKEREVRSYVYLLPIRRLG